MDQLVVEAGQVFGVTGGQHLGAGEEVDGPADVGITLVPLGCAVIPGGVAVDDLIGGLAEDIDILIAYLLADLHIGTVHGAQRQRTVQHELHVAGAGGLLGGKADLLGQVAGRNEFFGGGDVVIFHKDHLQPLGYLRVCRNHFGYRQQRMDDIFGNDISRSRLRSGRYRCWYC